MNNTAKTTPAVPTKRKRGRPAKLPDSNEYKGNVDIGKALELRLVNRLPYDAIAKQLKCSKSNIIQRLKPFIGILLDPDTIAQYNNNTVRKSLFDSVELRMLSKMTDENTLKAASLNNTAYAFKEVFNAGRLDAGLSTANISVQISDSERTGLEAIARQAAIEYISKVGENTDNEAVNEPDNAG